MPTRFVDLPAYLTSLLESPSISANGLRQLHRSLEETWERVSVDSFLAGHKSGFLLKKNPAGIRYLREHKR